VLRLLYNYYTFPPIRYYYSPAPVLLVSVTISVVARIDVYRLRSVTIRYYQLGVNACARAHENFKPKTRNLKPETRRPG